MTLRSTFTKLLGSLSPLGSIGATWAGAAVAAGLFAVSVASYTGCDNGSLVCDSNGKNCKICDAYGCHAATPEGTGGNGAGGATATGGAVNTGGKANTGGASSTGGAGTGGAAPCNPKVATCACTDTSMCSDGKQCIDGLCIVGCNFSYECGAGKVCINGTCAPGCDSTKPCAAGYACTKGVCTVDPTSPACSATNPCSNGQTCVGGLCTTSCTADSQCASGEVCDGTTHTCIANPAPTPVCDTSKPCPAPQVCEADGYCHYPCSTEAQCKLIDNRFVACNQGVCKTDAEVNPECTLTKPCPAGKDCVSNKCL